LINYYRDGKDRVAWHSDDEKELGINPVIASVSLGAERKFQVSTQEIQRKST
jgi:alkylated DNA repair dioxygenase AlkB